jgi:hypothetical protein
MSVKLKTPSNGSVTLAPEDTGSDVVLTVPAVAGELFGQGNILGTVSQSGGVPTGAIIERGSNANGGFVRYADGTMLLISPIFSGINVTTASGSGFMSGNVTWNLPQTFAAADFAVSAQHASSLAGWGNGLRTSNSQVTFRLFEFTSQPGRAGQAFAVGRWY